MNKRLIRRERAHDRLETQLELGMKPTRLGLVPLTDSNRARIRRELNTLQQKLCLRA